MFRLTRSLAATSTRLARCISKASVLRAPPPTRSAFSGMSNEGLTESQIDVRTSIAKICEEFPDEYWAEKDQ